MRKSTLVYVAVVGIVALVAYRAGNHNAQTPSAETMHQNEKTGHDAGHEEGIALAGDSQKLAGIKTAPVKYDSFNSVLTATGEVTPNTNKMVKVGSLVAGRISRLQANVGDVVRAGQVLATVDSTDVGRARAAHSQATANLNLAQIKLANTKRLARAGVFSRKPLDEVRRERAQVSSEYSSAQVDHNNELASAEGAVKTAEAAFSRAEADRKLALAEMERKKQLVAAGAFQYKPLEDAQNEMAEARALLITTENAVNLTASQLRRAEKLFEVGTTSKREVESARAAVAETKANLERTKARAEIAKQSLAREQKIFDQKIHTTRETQGTENEYARAQRESDQKEAELTQARRRLELARSSQKATALDQMKERLQTLDSMLQRELQVSQQNLANIREVAEAEAGIEQAKIELKAATEALRVLRLSAALKTSVGVAIVAPISGRVLDRPVNRGEVVDPSTTLFTLLDLSSVWVDSNLAEKSLHQVSRGQRVEVIATALPTETYVGKISYIADTVDEKTRTVRVRCEISNPQRKLKPGMFVQATFSIGKGKGLLIPETSVQREGQTTSVYVAEGEGKYCKREVTLGTRTDGYHEVRQGLKAGEKVVTEGAFLLKAQIQKESFGEATCVH